MLHIEKINNNSQSQRLLEQNLFLTEPRPSFSASITAEEFSELLRQLHPSNIILTPSKMLHEDTLNFMDIYILGTQALLKFGPSDISDKIIANALSLKKIRDFDIHQFKLPEKATQFLLKSNQRQRRLFFLNEAARTKLCAFSDQSLTVMDLGLSIIGHLDEGHGVPRAITETGLQWQVSNLVEQGLNNSIDVIANLLGKTVPQPYGNIITMVGTKIIVQKVWPPLAKFVQSTVEEITRQSFGTDDIYAPIPFSKALENVRQNIESERLRFPWHSTKESTDKNVRATESNTFSQSNTLEFKPSDTEINELLQNPSLGTDFILTLPSSKGDYANEKIKFEAIYISTSTMGNIKVQETLTILPSNVGLEVEAASDQRLQPLLNTELMAEVIRRRLIYWEYPKYHSEESSNRVSPRSRLTITYNQERKGLMLNVVTSHPIVAATILGYASLIEFYKWASKSAQEHSIDRFETYLSEIQATDEQEWTLRFCANIIRPLKSIISNEVYNERKEQLLKQIHDQRIPALLDTHPHDSAKRLVFHAIQYAIEKNKHEFVKDWQNHDFEGTVKFYLDSNKQLTHRFLEAYAKNDNQEMLKHLHELKESFGETLAPYLCKSFYEIDQGHLTEAKHNMSQAHALGLISAEQTQVFMEGIQWEYWQHSYKKINSLTHDNKQDLLYELDTFIKQQLVENPTSIDWQEAKVSIAKETVAHFEKKLSNENQVAMGDKIHDENKQWLIQSYFSLVDVEVINGNINQQKKYLKKILSLDDKEASAWNELGSIYLNKKFNKAVHCYENAIKNNKDLADDIVNLGSMYSKQHKFFEAKKLLALVADSNHSSMDSHTINNASKKLKAIHNYELKRLKLFALDMGDSVLRILIGCLESKLDNKNYKKILSVCSSSCHVVKTFGIEVLRKRSQKALEIAAGTKINANKNNSFNSQGYQMVALFSLINEFNDDPKLRKDLEDMQTFLAVQDILQNFQSGFVAKDSTTYLGVNTDFLMAGYLTLSLTGSLLHKHFAELRASTDKGFYEYRPLYVVEDASALLTNPLLGLSIQAYQYSDVILNIGQNVITYLPTDAITQILPDTAIQVGTAVALGTKKVVVAGTTAAKAGAAKAALIWAGLGTTGKVIICSAGAAGAVVIVGYTAYKIKKHYDHKHVLTLDKNAKISLKKGESILALEKLEEAYTYEPNNLKVKLRLEKAKPLALIQKGDLEGAIHLITQCLKNNADDHKLKHLHKLKEIRAKAFYAQGKKDLAENDFKDILSENNNATNIRLQLALILGEKGQIRNAKEHIDYIIEFFKELLTKKNSQLTQDNILVINQYLQQMQQTLEEFDQAMTQNWENINLQFNVIFSSLQQTLQAPLKTISSEPAVEKEYSALKNNIIEHVTSIIQHNFENWYDKHQANLHYFYEPIVNSEIEFMIVSILEKDEIYMSYLKPFLNHLEKIMYVEFSQLKEKELKELESARLALSEEQYQQLKKEFLKKFQNTEEQLKNNMIIDLQDELKNFKNTLGEELKKQKQKMFEKIKACYSDNNSAVWSNAFSEIITSVVTNAISSFYELCKEKYSIQSLFAINSNWKHKILMFPKSENIMAFVKNENELVFQKQKSEKELSAKLYKNNNARCFFQETTKKCEFESQSEQLVFEKEPGLVFDEMTFSM